MRDHKQRTEELSSHHRISPIGKWQSNKWIFGLVSRSKAWAKPGTCVCVWKITWKVKVVSCAENRKIRNYPRDREREWRERERERGEFSQLVRNRTGPTPVNGLRPGMPHRSRRIAVIADFRMRNVEHWHRSSVANSAIFRTDLSFLKLL